ncbi:MAG: B12-binding domain-containing radical SAM protein [Treponema sp.]|nr:B12-binding domain-containing radical SAM protein [Treponema sp.]
MSEVLIVAVNSSFSHTNIAVRYLKYYAEGKFPGRTEFCEYTINQPMGEIIRGVNSYNPKVVLFSTYIWNVEAVERIAKNLKALKPELIIGAGGPEAGFRGADFLKENPDFDLIVKGEGESVFARLVEKYATAKEEDFLTSLSDLKGLYLRNPASPDEVIFTGEQELICDLGELPFPYPDLELLDVNHKIFYYESSRGCPFSCAYCMSSLDKKVRFVPLEKVFADLQRFLDAGVKLVKFVDRTYNLKPERYIAIWKYITEHHNGKTMFHFEIEGEFLSEEAMEFLQTVPEGIMQFEIGVQSSNPVVLKACGRSPETETLKSNILRIPKTIHTHLDLIAGLPFEDLESFGRSFDFVMNIEPDALQLGFLKVLFGAPINSFCSSTGWKWMKTPPYEVLETPYLSYDEILFLKDLENCLDAYWNDHNFDIVMKYLAAAVSEGTDPSAHLADQTKGTDPSAFGKRWWKLFVSLTKWLQSKNVFASAHQKDYWAEMLHEYLTSSLLLPPSALFVARELLRFDYIAGGKKTNPPAWLCRHYDDQAHYDALRATTGIKHSRLDFVYSDYDSFAVNPLDPETWFSKAKGTDLLEKLTDQSEGTDPLAAFAADLPSFPILFLYARKESDRPSDFQRKPHQILVESGNQSSYIIETKKEVEE